MKNLKEETQLTIQSNGYSPNDIIFIGAEESGYSCSWEEFQVLANKDYDNGYGGAEVAGDLIIVFSDGAVMRRGEYDGSEWWNFYPPFQMPKQIFPIENLFVNKLGEKEDDW